MTGLIFKRLKPNLEHSALWSVLHEQNDTRAHTHHQGPCEFRSYVLAEYEAAERKGAQVLSA